MARCNRRKCNAHSRPDYTEGGAGSHARNRRENEQIVACELTIEVERSGIWHAPPRRDRRLRASGEPPALTRPIRGTIGSGTFRARPSALPLPKASVSAVTFVDVLEFVRNDDYAIDEIARVLEGGGRLRLRVPAKGPFAGFDAYNLLHYLVDMTHRGQRPYETSDLGWRRHYSVDDLIGLLGRDRFRIVTVHRRRFGIGELFHFAGMVLFRWPKKSQKRYMKVRRFAQAIERLEHRLVSPIGSVIELEAIRLPLPNDR